MFVVGIVNLPCGSKPTVIDQVTISKRVLPTATA